MTDPTAHRAIAIVAAGAVLPDAPNVSAFWENTKGGRYSITDVSPDRWDPALYYDPDPKAPDKTYSKIGAWVREYPWEPVKWKLALPPRVIDAMDGGQKWALACTREALEDYGYPKRSLDADRTAVILGNAMGGEQHYFTSLRIYFPEFARELAECTSFAALPPAVQRDINREVRSRMAQRLPAVTEDSMPGELANCIAGRVANVFNFHGPNFTTDAACASAMAALSAAVEGLVAHHYDTAITGGIDRNMGASSFAKFCKIGALSATGSRPYAEGADGFVMGEGAAIFILKRLSDAERDGDRIYAVIRGIGGSSDGKGKGITAPNPVGQKIAIERAWRCAGLSPSAATYIEGHGTSTSVGDTVEIQSMAGVLAGFDMPPGSVALGSVKSNIGHLKGAAGAAGLLKASLSLRDRILPPSLNCERKNPNVDFGHCPLYVNTELRAWPAPANGDVRCMGASAFGFGGTNWHIVLEEYIPHRLNGNGRRTLAVYETPAAGSDRPTTAAAGPATPTGFSKAPLRGALVVGAPSADQLARRLDAIHKAASAGRAPSPAPPLEADLRAPERVAIDYGDAAELAAKSAATLKALTADQPAMWKALRAQGIFRGRGPAPKVAFLYTGQGSQYANMLRPLAAREPIIADAFAEADRVMQPLLGKPLTKFVFVDPTDPAAVEKAEDDLRQTEITQPTVLTIDIAITRLLAAYGIRPDFTMGHSLGEYGALVASGSLPFDQALQAVSARGRGMTQVSLQDNGKMAAVLAPLGEIERLLETIDGYVVIANHNSRSQAVIGGASSAVDQAVAAFQKAGYNAFLLPVSHAFHTSIVAPASEPLRLVLKQLGLASPKIPIVTNVTGEFYPMGPGVVPQMIDLLARQVASPVQFVKGLEVLYDAGARVFVEVGPKKALHGFAEDVLGSRPDAVALFTNHPKFDDTVAFNQALCGIYATGLGAGRTDEIDTAEARATVPARPTKDPANEPVVITGAALGLPGTEHIFDDANVGRILNGEQFIDAIPNRFRRAMADKHITRLVKTDSGGPVFETIDKPADVIKLAGRGGAFDLAKEFGVAADRIPALDRVTRLAIAAGIDALRDAGIPLVQRYKTTTKNTQLPDRWGLADEMRDETGVIFASCWPGFDSFAQETSSFYADRARRDQLALIESLRARAEGLNGAAATLLQEMDSRIEELRIALERNPYSFDRRLIFRSLSMGHSQFAEVIGARGPNTSINAACASTTQGVALAQDWIRAGRCRRVIVVAADDISSDNLMEWLGSAFLASGAAATDGNVEDAALPFDRRRHGMIIGMGAAALVVESADAVRERGLRPICQVLSTVTANSAFHGTRLDVEHIGRIMESLVSQAEARGDFSRREAAANMIFISHETYTPARGGSASAEINALRKTFGQDADRIVIANTKGLTGHAMGAGIEDVVAVKAIETGCVPAVPNFKEVDPELGTLNLSKGGSYPVEYALRLGAGFGSQIAMTLLRRVPAKDGHRPRANALGYQYRIEDRSAWTAWLNRLTNDPAAELEVVCRTLVVHDRKGAAAPRHAPAAEAKPVPAEPAPSAAPKSPEPAPHPAAPAAQPADPVRERVLALVVEKTGYPREMLDLELDLEADLGVDTVKQAELFAAIREIYGIPRDPDLKLRDFPTLTHVIRFVRDRRPDLAAAPVAPQPKPPHPEPPPPQPVAAADDPVRDRVIELVVEKTGYPREMLDLELDLEADLGVDTVKQAELFAAIREIYGIPRDPDLKLRDFPTLSHVIGFIRERRPDLAAAPAAPPPKPKAPEPQPPQPVAAADDPVRDRVIELVVEKTGYPREMLDLELDLEADLGVDTVKQAELFAAIREIYGIPRDPDLKLRDFPTLSHVIGFVRDRRPDLAAAPAAAPPAPPEPVAVGSDPIQEQVLDIVVAKTGYPKEMLNLELDLEADLGIDTVKQAEMFASVREAFGIERDPDLKLRDFPTLADVIQFARSRSSLTAPAPAAVDAGTQVAVPPLEAAGRVPRRVPVAQLRPPITLMKPTGVRLQAGSRVVVMPDRGGVADALTDNLRAMGVEVLRIEDAADGPVQGVFWLSALDPEGDLSRMDLTQWHEALHIRVKSLFVTMRGRYEQIAPAGTFLVSATRLGGQHGYDSTGASCPLGGAVTGFTKTYKRERPDALVKAVDFEPFANAREIAAGLIAETLHDPGAVEVGYKAGLRWTIGLEEQSAASGDPGMTLDSNTVFVITGAAGSIVSAITADLAAASHGTFYLLDLAPEPDLSNPDLARFVSDRDGLKRELFARIQARGERATPVLVEKELAAIERAQAAAAAIEAVRTAGGSVRYFCLNLTDSEAVAAVIAEVRKASGRIDVLLHAAGIERSHFLPAKDPREFDLVFDVKADGWFNLLHAIDDMPLRATIAFSSIAGRFGNAGQADYSAANDLLCKIASSFRSTHPATRAIVIDWTAWAGIGMAARGSIPKMMELAGIDMLPPEVGVPVIRRELTAGTRAGEIVIAERLGVLTKEWDDTGGLEPAAVASSFQGPMAGRAASMPLHGDLVVETTLDPKRQPFLDHHRIDGTPVLPGVMGIEAFAEAAQSIMPGWHVTGIDDVDFLAPFKFYRDEPRTVTVKAAFRPEGDEMVASCRLIGSRVLPNQAEPQLTTHFSARVRLSRNRPEALSSSSVWAPTTGVVEASEIYRLYFHGPAYQVLQRTWSNGSWIVGEMAEGLPANHDPADLPLLSAPRLIELCFQTAGIWEMSMDGRMALPRRIDHVRLSGAVPESEVRLYAVVTPGSESAGFHAEVVDEAGNRYLELCGYRTIPLSDALDVESLRKAMRPAAMAAGG